MIRLIRSRHRLSLQTNAGKVPTPNLVWRLRSEKIDSHDSDTRQDAHRLQTAFRANRSSLVAKGLRNGHQPIRRELEMGDVAPSVSCTQTGISLSLH
jgi:hypothetical protein